MVALFLLFSALVPVSSGASGLVDVTAELKVEVSGFRRDRRSGELVQQVTLTNLGRRDLAGELFLSLSGLQPEVSVSGGRRLADSPAGRVALVIPVAPRLQPVLKPGQRVTTFLRFAESPAQRIRYQPRVLHKPPSQ